MADRSRFSFIFFASVEFISFRAFCFSFSRNSKFLHFFLIMDSFYYLLLSLLPIVFVLVLQRKKMYDDEVRKDRVLSLSAVGSDVNIAL